MLDLPAHAGRRAQRAASRRAASRSSSSARRRSSASASPPGASPSHERARPRLRRRSRATRASPRTRAARSGGSPVGDAQRARAGPTAARSARARSAPAPRRAAPRRAARARRPARAARRRRRPRPAAIVDRARPRAHAGELGRDRAPAEAGVLEDPVGQPGVVERLDLERHDPDVGAEDEPRGRLVVERAEPDEAAASRGTAAKSGSPAASSSCTAPTSSSDELVGMRSATARSSAQSVRQPRWPSETATTVAARSGAGKESAASGDERGVAAGRRARAGELVADDEGQRRAAPRRARAAPRGARAAAARRRRRARSGPSARTRARTPGDRVDASPRASGSCSGWKMTTTRRAAAAARCSSRRASQPRRAAPATAARQARERAVGHAAAGRRATTPRRAQQVLGLVAQDEALERARAAGGRRAARPPRGRLVPTAGGRLATRGRIPSPPVGASSSAWLTSGAAYQASSLLASVLALFTLPLYTRAPDDRREFGYAETLLTFIILVIDPAAPRDRRGVRPLLVRRRGRPARRDRLARTTTAFVLALDHRRRAHRASRSPGRCRRLLLGIRGRDAHVRRHPRPLGVHEPRDRLRAAARRGAPPRVPHRRR